MTLIKFFAYLVDKVGFSEAKLNLTNCKTVGDVRDLISSEFPEIAADINRCMIAVDMSFETDEVVIEDVDEIAVIPPVSGG